MHKHIFTHVVFISLV